MKTLIMNQVFRMPLLLFAVIMPHPSPVCNPPASFPVIPGQKKDRAFLEQHYPDKDIHWIAGQLAKSPSACLSQARKMHLKRSAVQFWTADEDAFLKQHYSEEGPRWTAEQLGRSLSACQHRAARVCARSNRIHLPWTPEEDALLIKYQYRKTHREIAQILHRTKDACDSRAKKLGITKNYNIYYS